MRKAKGPTDTGRYSESPKVANSCYQTVSTGLERKSTKGNETNSSSSKSGHFVNLDHTSTSQDLKPSDTAVYRRVCLTPNDFNTRTADCLDKIADAESIGNQRKIRRKAEALRRCGTFVVARRCPECGEFDPYSGHIFASCSLRVCPYCSKHRAGVIVGRLVESVDKIPKRSRYRFSVLTFTTNYDPGNPEHLTVDAIKQRIDRLQRAISYVWSRVLRASETGLVVFCEVSTRGEVHAHALYYGPRTEIDRIRIAYQIALSSRDHVEVNPPIESYEELKRALYYSAKGPSSSGEMVFPTRSLKQMDPELAARVEVALSGKRLFERYGVFRKPVRKTSSIQNDDEESRLGTSSAQGQTDSANSDLNRVTEFGYEIHQTNNHNVEENLNQRPEGFVQAGSSTTRDTVQSFELSPPTESDDRINERSTLETEPVAIEEITPPFVYPSERELERETNRISDVIGISYQGEQDAAQPVGLTIRETSQSDDPDTSTEHNDATMLVTEGEEIEETNPLYSNQLEQKLEPEPLETKVSEYDCCPHCGCHEPQWEWVSLPMEEWLAIAAKE